MFLWFHKLGSPPHFYRIAGKWIPWLNWIFMLLLLAGLYGGLILAPPDYQQGESYRMGVFMVGAYQMQNEAGELFNIEIPAFSLDSPHEKHAIN